TNCVIVKTPSKINQKNTTKEKKEAFSYNKENETTEQLRHRSYQGENKRNSTKEKKEYHTTKYLKKVTRSPIMLGENRSKQFKRIEDTQKRERGTKPLLIVAKVVQKKHLAVGNWLPSQRSQLQNIQSSHQVVTEKEQEKYEGEYKTKRSRDIIIGN
ncbi:21077_t:CDS:1, partial [Gigaspora rosea]